MREEIYRDGKLVSVAESPDPEPTPEAFAAAIQALIDDTARSRGYGDGYGLASYVTSTVATWAAEAKAFVTWRDSVWLYAYAIQAAVADGEANPPSVDELIGKLPAMVWPG